MKRAWIGLVALVACASPRIPNVPPNNAEAPKKEDLKPRRHPPSAAIVFRAPGFPTIDAPPIDDADFAGLELRFATTIDALSADLRAHPFDLLVLPYGSAFPVDAWPAIHAFVRGGGSLAVLGGAPFGQPVYRSGDAWKLGPPSPAFQHELLIGPAEPLAMADGSTTFALTLRLAREKSYPDEHGSAGPRDARVKALETIKDAAGTPRGCPLLEIDRLRGPEAGARWVFATTNKPLGANRIREVIKHALLGAETTQVTVKRATVAVGEPIEVDVKSDAPFDVVVFDPSGKPLPKNARPTTPGLHLVRVSPSDRTTGVWVRDPALLKKGPHLTVGRDWLLKDGKTFPIVGTTYMASDVDRDFLFEPNPAVWEQDFAAMQKHGINFVRTGLWTAWSRVMKDNTVDPRILDAAEAFVATAARHGIVVCFNLFAFLPPIFDGTNNYLDPRSISGQKALATAFAARFNGVPWVHWDLINEPSYAPRAKLWSTKPIGDSTEAAAWRDWIAKRHKGASVGELAALYRDASDNRLAVPVDDDFERAPVQAGRHPRKARDFREFSEEVVAKWAGTMRDAIKRAGGGPLVTLGQDEGGIYERATQQFLAPSLDYTSVHTWWKNDDLLWDGILTKVAGKPSLHQETGLMRLERTDGTPWRTPEMAAKLLERKLGYAFAARGAGVVEWVWNVNPNMPLDEEVTIGLFRPDGTAKPELDVLEKYARFFDKAAPYLADFEPEEVVLLIPHARAFLGMSGALDASKVIVRVLGERYGIFPTAISDLRVESKDLIGKKLVIVSNPSVLDERAAKALLDASKTGVKILVTGAIEGDSYGLPTPSLKALGLLKPSRPVAMHEKTDFGDVDLTNLAQETVLRADTGSRSPTWHLPVPMELSGDLDPLERLLWSALSEARVGDGVPKGPTQAGVVNRVLLAPRYALIVVVNERPEDKVGGTRVDGHPVGLPVAALGTSLAIVERATGKIVVKSE